MSNWFKDRRQEFIAATLKQFGQIRRADIMREFGVSVPQASLDIADFLAQQPALVRYDVSAKVYVLIDEYESRPFAYCCAEGGGDPASCDCVKPDHGTALFPSARA